MSIPVRIRAVVLLLIAGAVMSFGKCDPPNDGSGGDWRVASAQSEQLCYWC